MPINVGGLNNITTNNKGLKTGSLGNVVVTKSSGLQLPTTDLQITTDQNSLPNVNNGLIDLDTQVTDQNLIEVSISRNSEVDTNNNNCDYTIVPPVFIKNSTIIDDHGKLKGLSDDDHPHYLQKTEASQIYQRIIHIGSTPPSNPYYGQIWIEI